MLSVGPVVRVGPKRYSIIQPQAVKTIYDLSGKYTKSSFYNAQGSDDDIFTMRDNTEQRDRRRKVAPLYSMSAMVSYEDAIDRMTTICMGKMDEFAKEKRLISIPNFMQFYAWDVIGEITFDQNFGMMKNMGDTQGIIKEIHTANNNMARLGLLPELQKPYHILEKLIFGRHPMANVIDYIMSQCQKHRDSNTGTKMKSQFDTFLRKILEQEAAHKVETKKVFDACGSNIVAGSDTTGISLSAAIYYLYQNPDKLAKLREEIDTMTSEGRISNPVTYHQAKDMPYLNAVIKETLRMHPAVGTILPRIVPKGGMTLEGYYFREGTHVGTNAWPLHYSEDVYGPDADQYRPERWLEDKSDFEYRDSMMFAFGGGLRTCIGRNIVLLEMTKFLPQIVRRIDFKFEEEKPWDLSCSFLVYPSYKCWVELRENKAQK
ncbi:Cytochrome P450 [Penicillium griseofulvum]|uniref:Cytochrome P450 n=1 Tax=Penicillium patulum TaxID=5078 RepID=A0A135LJR4_PENPA|nr:Cytochrome P450 [Penicillium griseofulvum]KXG49221.1 Cytochrome P450 [Penicillium griseofulvum]